MYTLGLALALALINRKVALAERLAEKGQIEAKDQMPFLKQLRLRCLLQGEWIEISKKGAWTK